MKKVLVFGSGGHAKVILDILELDKKYEVFGIVDASYPVNSKVYGYTVLGNETCLPHVRDKIDGGIVAIGDNYIRNKVVEKIKTIMPTFHFICAVHPMSTIARDVIIQEGTAVMANAVINSNTRIGKHCIVNTSCSIDHDCVIDDYVTIGPGAILGGNVKVGNGSAILLGASVIHSITIGEHALVAAGAVAIKDVKSFTVAMGIPAKAIKTRKEGDRYL